MSKGWTKKKRQKASSNQEKTTLSLIMLTKQYGYITKPQSWIVRIETSHLSVSIHPIWQHRFACFCVPIEVKVHVDLQSFSWWNLMWSCPCISLRLVYWKEYWTDSRICRASFDWVTRYLCRLVLKANFTERSCSRFYASLRGIRCTETGLFSSHKRMRSSGTR